MGARWSARAAGVPSAAPLLPPPGVQSTLHAHAPSEATLALEAEETDSLPSASVRARAVCVVRTLRVALGAVYVLVGILIGLGIWILIDDGAEPHAVAWAAGAMFCAVAIPLSLHDIIMHVLHYKRPELQRHVIRILGMVPVYALESWCALRFTEQALLFETLRECYEALVLWSFYKLLVGWLGDGDALRWRMREARIAGPGSRLLPPCCCWSWTPADTFLYRCGVGIFQYVIVRLLTTIMVIPLYYTGYYEEGEFSVGNSYIWLAGIILSSQCWALYCLLQFYWDLRVELAPLQPVLKFAVVKSIIFLTFYQQLLIALLVTMDVIKPLLNFSQQEVAKGLQDLCICVEMALLAVLMHLAFNYTQFEGLARRAAIASAEDTAADDAADSVATPGSDGVASAAAAGRAAASKLPSPPPGGKAGGTAAAASERAEPDIDAGLRRAFYDMLPLDIVADTSHMARSLTERQRSYDDVRASSGAATALLSAPSRSFSFANIFSTAAQQQQPPSPPPPPPPLFAATSFQSADDSMSPSLLTPKKKTGRASKS